MTQFTGGSSNFPLLSKPYIVGYMSTDVNRQYNADLSQLKYVTVKLNGSVSLDLNHNIDNAVKRTTEDNVEKITLLLKFLLDQRSRLVAVLKDFTFISYRRTLISVMCSAFNGSHHICIVASLFDGCIYLCSIETPEKIKFRLSESEQMKKFCAWGYKFEQFLLADLPTAQPNVQHPVIENEEFSLVYCSTLGKHELLYGAQIDGMLATSGNVKDPPKTNCVETNLNYLRENEFVELKTNRELQFKRQEYNFRRHKMLTCWGQCYLAGLKGLLVGFRDDDGVIHRVQAYNTEDIVEYCQNEWQPDMALRFLDSFLSYVKECFRNELNKRHGNNYNVSNLEPISIQFDIDGNRTISVTNLDNSKHDFDILPDWFLESKSK